MLAKTSKQPPVKLGVVGVAIGTLHVAEPELAFGIPQTLSRFLGGLMLCLLFPCGDGFEAAPIRNRDAKPVRAANGLNAQKAWLLCRKLNHAVRHVAVAPVTCGALGGQDNRIIGGSWVAAKELFGMPWVKSKRGNGSPRIARIELRITDLDNDHLRHWWHWCHLPSAVSAAHRLWPVSILFRWVIPKKSQGSRQRR